MCEIENAVGNVSAHAAMVGEGLIASLGIYAGQLDEKKEQTTKKIELVKNYVEQWLRVWVNQKPMKSVTFIDAMCNAGVYRDGGFTSCAEVYELFLAVSKQHPAIEFRLYINDCDAGRVNTCIKVLAALGKDAPANLRVVYASLDVNQFLHEAAVTSEIPKGPGNAVLLFVDPYDAGTVHIGKLVEFIGSRYCEVLFNWFSSDLTRNGFDNRISSCVSGLEFPTDADPADVIAEALTAGNMKLAFRYAFRNSRNAELYQIIFVTPHKQGLSKLKAALWQTFHGAKYHKNSHQQKRQTRLFDDDVLEDSRVLEYAPEAREQLVIRFSGRAGVLYAELEEYLLLHTMLCENHLITHVLKPCIEAGQVTKDATTLRANNFKGDTYTFPPCTG